MLGRYRLLEQLGSGGFGVVWRARDELLHREVAVKQVWLGLDGDSERASREALAAARLSHPAIVALYEACPHEGAFYLISELVDGDTLAQLIAHDALEDEEILEIGLALASALEHAHERGVIHRDIKPQNVLVPTPPAGGARTPQTLLAAAKLTDFGGASLVGEDALTRTGDVLGTLAYMAPEQSEGQEIGVQVDLYSLALVLYEALSGANPVRASTPAATARRIGRALPPLARSRRDLPPALTRALDRALSPAPSDRGTLEDLRLALEQTLARGLTRRSWRRARAQQPFEPTPPRIPVGARGASPAHAPVSPPARALQPRERLLPGRELEAEGSELADAPAAEPGRRIALPRQIWLACALALVAWQALAGRPGVALLAFAALLALLVLPGERRSSRLGAWWLAAALAPVLGLAGLAGAFPAIAGQARARRARRARILVAEPRRAAGRSRTIGRAPAVARAGGGNARTSRLGGLVQPHRHARDRSDAGPRPAAGSAAVGRRRGRAPVARSWTQRRARPARGHRLDGGDRRRGAGAGRRPQRSRRASQPARRGRRCDPRCPVRARRPRPARACLGASSRQVASKGA